MDYNFTGKRFIPVEGDENKGFYRDTESNAIVMTDGDEYSKYMQSYNERQRKKSAFTALQKGCERLERSISHENPNHILLTELWSSKEDWDVYFASQQKLRDENGWNARFLPLLEEDGVQITFSEMDKSL